jgi:hypothetical protein
MLTGGCLAARRLWSLWEMLTEVGAVWFTDCQRAFQEAQAHFSKPEDAAKKVAGSDYEWLVDNLLMYFDDHMLHHIHLPATTNMRDSIETKCFTHVSNAEIAKWLFALECCWTSELGATHFLALGGASSRYFAPADQLFGAEFQAKFISSIFELDEAGKCLALSRPTASVFHLMRLMEYGLRAVAQCLSIPDPIKPSGRNWGGILGAIKTDIDAHSGQSPTKIWALPTDKEIFENAYASLDAVRVAWRNPTMHVENKYTDDEAEHIFVAVKGFMMKLASRCDENGEPKA